MRQVLIYFSGDETERPMAEAINRYPELTRLCLLTLGAACLEGDRGTASFAKWLSLWRFAQMDKVEKVKS